MDVRLEFEQCPFVFLDNVNTHQSGEQDVENGANHQPEQSKIRSGTAVQSKTTCGNASSTKALS